MHIRAGIDPSVFIVDKSTKCKSWHWQLSTNHCTNFSILTVCRVEYMVPNSSLNEWKSHFGVVGSKIFTIVTYNLDFTHTNSRLWRSYFIGNKSFLRVFFLVFYYFYFVDSDPCLSTVIIFISKCSELIIQSVLSFGLWAGWHFQYRTLSDSWARK